MATRVIDRGYTLAALLALGVAGCSGAIAPISDAAAPRPDAAATDAYPPDNSPACPAVEPTLPSHCPVADDGLACVWPRSDRPACTTHCTCSSMGGLNPPFWYCGVNNCP